MFGRRKKPAEVLVEGSWIRVADLPEALATHMRAVRRAEQEAKGLAIELDRLRRQPGCCCGGCVL